MQRFISFLLIIALCLGLLPVSAEEIGEKSARPVATATPEPIIDEAAISPYAIQDPSAFGGGAVSFYSNEDNTYCKRRVYQVSGMSAQAFCEAYAETCKTLGTMTYLETTASPSGWVYLCFASAAGYAFDDFSTSSGDWSTGSLCLSISYAADSSYVTLRFSHDLELADLGNRLPAATKAPAAINKKNNFIVQVKTATPAPTDTPAPEATKAPGAAIGKKNNFISKAKTATATPVPTTAPTAVPTATPTAKPTTVPVTPMPADAIKASNCLQDPVIFSEGQVKFYSNDDSQHCHRSNYHVTAGSAAEFAKAYADMCKKHPALTYLELSTSPSGWSYYCFAPAADSNYKVFTNTSGEWSTANLVLSISFKESSQYITLCWSHGLDMSDLGYRLSTMSSLENAAPSAALDDLKAIWLDSTPYYYNQLSEAHKQAYEVCISNVLNFPHQTSANRDYHHQALGSMIMIDNPRIFWVDWIDSNGWLRYNTGDVTHMRAVQFPEGETLATLQTAFLDAIPAAVAQIEKSLPKNASTRDTVKAIHDWLCKNNSYNAKQTSSHKKESDPVAFAYLAAHAAFSAIIPGDAYKPVCEGYAGAFQILCEEFGIEAICVPGYAKNIGNHTWNYVKLDDGQWYLVDVDADDLAASYVHTYFLLTESQRAQYGYDPAPYLNSGVNPSNGYTEGAAFTFPELAK